jgi:HK97 family phage major capsid protein
MTTFDTPPAGFDFEALRRLSPQQRLDRQRAISDKLQPLADHDKLTRAQEQIFNELRFEFNALVRIGELEEIRSLSTGYTEGGATGMGDEPSRSGNPTRDAAMRHMDTYVRSGDMDAASAERVERLMRESLNAPLAQRWAAAGSDPAYVSAFFKALRSDGKGHMLWTPQEQAAYARVEAVRSEMRSMTAGTTTTGGFQIPTIIDPAIRISSDGSVSPIRQLAEVRSEMGSTFRPVTSAHVTNVWTAESAEVDDGTPTLASPEIDAHKSTSFVPFSFEYESATGGAVAELSRLLVDGLDQLTAEAFLNGNGTTAPQGLWTGIDGGDSELDPATAEVFADADVYATQNALPPRFQPNATWQANLATINELSQSETANGARLFGGLDQENPVLLRKRIHENSRMRGTGDIDTAATADNPVLIYGDIRQAYTIVDFAGSSIELVSHLFHADNNLPSGERGLLLWARTGAGVTIANAVRAMNVVTAA